MWLRAALSAVITFLGCPARPEAPPPQPAAAHGLAPARVLALARHPKRLLSMVDPARGVLVARVLGCENDEGMEVVRHACGRAVARELTPLLPGLAEQVRRAQMYEEDGLGVVCG